MIAKGHARFLFPIIALILILSGCTAKKTPVEKIYDVLEKVVSKEKVFEEQQAPLVSLEKQEKEIYDQIIELGMKEYDQIVKLADEALALTNKRKEHMEKETDSIKESEQEFQKFADIKGELGDPALTKIANELDETMIQRYNAHKELYEDYMDALKYDQELYMMFKNKDIPIADLEAQVNKLNDMYKKVYEDNEKFNKYTELYNDKKMSFYKKAGLNSK